VAALGVRGPARRTRQTAEVLELLDGALAAFVGRQIHREIITSLSLLRKACCTAVARMIRWAGRLLRRSSAMPTRRILPAVLAVLSLLPATIARAQTTVEAWHRWERVLTTTRDYHLVNGGPTLDNPYRKLNLQVTYSPAAGCTGPWCNGFTAPGFWDGGRTFKIRGTFPVGTWQWAVTCTGSSGGFNCATDPALNTGGTIQVVNQVTTDPPLLEKGLPRVAASKRFLTLGDGVTPLRWLADTAWFAAIKDGANHARWETFLVDRKTKGFTVVLLAPAPSDDSAGVATGQLFEDVPQSDAPCTGAAWPKPCSRWRPAYWQGLDEKIRLANQRGFLVVLIGIMDPQGNLPGGTPKYPDPAAAEVFARNLVARLAGSHVIYSPSFDDVLRTTEPLLDRVGAALKAAAPRHLVTAHLAGASKICDYYKVHSTKPWHSLHIFQSGHAFNRNDCKSTEDNYECAMRRARALPVLLAQGPTAANLAAQGCSGFPASTVRKPNANGEAAYDQSLTRSPTQVVDTPYGVRHSGYYSALDSAFGVTLGVKGIWDWVDISSAALNSDGSRQMRTLGQRLNLSPWQFLRREYGRIKQQQPDTEEDQKIVMAATDDNNFAMIYLPDNAEVKIDATFLTGFDCASSASPWVVTWTNPRTGRDLTPPASRCVNIVNDPQAPGATRKFSRPDCSPSNGDRGDLGDCDWLITLRRAGTYGAVPTTSTSAAVEVRAEEAEDGTGWWIVAQPRGVDGEPLGEPVPVIEPGPAEVRLPVAAPAPGGGTLIAWESEDDGYHHGVYVRRLDLMGLLPLPAARVNTTVELDQINPWVAALPHGGGGVVTWTSVAQDGDAGGIFARWIDGDGIPTGGEIPVNQTTAGHQDFPKVGMDLEGGFVVAWTSAAPESVEQGERVFARRFDRGGAPLGGEFEVGESFANMGRRYLTDLAVSPDGGFVVTWTSSADDGSLAGVFQQQYDADARLLGSPIQVAGPASPESTEP
jgi:Protein of unknown function (DUF4038)